MAFKSEGGMQKLDANMHILTDRCICTYTVEKGILFRAAVAEETKLLSK